MVEIWYFFASSWASVDLNLFFILLLLRAVNAIFTEHPLPATVISVGDNTTLSCSAAGFPAPDIVWTKDGSAEDALESNGIDINTLSSAPRTTQSSLRIRNASVNLTGIYHCLSINILSNAGLPPEVAESSPASFTVQGTVHSHCMQNKYSVKWYLMCYKA